MLEVVEKLLQFNPFFRYPAEELLKQPVFDSVRCPEMEKEAPYKIELDIDKLGAFNYKTMKSEISNFGYLSRIWEEMELINQLNK